MCKGVYRGLLLAVALLGVLGQRGVGQEAAPSVALGLNQERFQAGETLRLTVAITPGGARPVDAYLVLQLPGGRLLSYQADGRFIPGVHPVVRNWRVVPLTQEIFSYTFTGTEPLGSYRWLAGFTEPDNPGAVLGAIAQAPFTVEAAPSVVLSLNPPLNQGSFQAGETLRLTAALTPGGDRRVDAYLALQLPDGTRLFYQADGSFTPAMRPVVGNWRVVALTREIVRYTFTGCEPAGSYTWLGWLTVPGTQTVLGAIAEVSLTVDTAPRLVQVSGNNQVGHPGQVLPAPFVVQVEDQVTGQPARGCPVTATIIEGLAEFVVPSLTALTARGALALAAQSPAATTRTERTDAQGFVSFFVRVAPDSEGIIRTRVAVLDQQVEFLAVVGLLSPTDVAVEANGQLVVVDAILEAVVRVDPHSGTATIVSDATTGRGPRFGNLVPF